MSTLDNLKKTAKRWLKALRNDDAEGRSRMNRAHPDAPKNPNLRDVQHALDASAVMLQPRELRVPRPMELQGGLYSTTTDVWNMLLASRLGDLQQLENLVEVNPGLIRCEHNYMPPLHLAVREGHLELVRYLLELGAFDPGHVTYPYNETLLTIAKDRDFTEIAVLLETYPSAPKERAFTVRDTSIFRPIALTGTALNWKSLSKQTQPAPLMPCCRANPSSRMTTWHFGLRASSVCPPTAVDEECCNC